MPQQHILEADIGVRRRTLNRSTLEQSPPIGRAATSSMNTPSGADAAFGVDRPVRSPSAAAAAR